MKSTWNERLATARAFAHNFEFAVTARRRPPAGHLPDRESVVPSDFFGICVASSADERCDDYVVARLKELGLRHARVDMMRERSNERFLHRLLDEGFKVCLHLVQSVDEAADMANPATAALWRGFVAEMLDRHGSRVEIVEIGSVCNRRKWSGYTLLNYLISWRTAWKEAARRKVPLAGANVTDFEPFHNVAILGEMRRLGILPAAHTDNLFVERAMEPEAFDHKVMGRSFARLLRFNLVKKARLLNNISAWAGVPATICSQVSWSLRRIARQHGDIEGKQADYLARYCCLAAASGALDRVYWGPLIGQREGLIDDGTSQFPEIPHVAFYGTANGLVSGFRIRPAFLAFQTVNRFIAGAGFKRNRGGSDVEILEFEKNGTPIHAVWTRDGRQARAQDCYESAALQSAVAHTRDGELMDTAPPMFAESPVYLSWPSGAEPAVKETVSLIPGLKFATARSDGFATIDVPPWTGLAVARKDGRTVDQADLIDMVEDAGRRTHSGRLLRSGRNRVWTAPAPWDAGSSLVIKRFKGRSLARRILDAHKPDKAQRSWNASQELLRRGVATPLPIAFFHKSNRPARSECFFICEEFKNSLSVRDVFTKLAQSESAHACSSPAHTAPRPPKTVGHDGAGEDHGPRAAGSNIESPTFYEALARFLFDMHERGVFFKDLSAGNILFRRLISGDIEFALIDTARARFHGGKTPMRLRLCDLIRVCHPLHWEGRARFVGKYMEQAGRKFAAWMRAPFVFYDIKHRVKNAFKPMRMGVGKVKTLKKGTSISLK